MSTPTPGIRHPRHGIPGSGRRLSEFSSARTSQTPSSHKKNGNKKRKRDVSSGPSGQFRPTMPPHSSSMEQVASREGMAPNSSFWEQTSGAPVPRGPIHIFVRPDRTGRTSWGQPPRGHTPATQTPRRQPPNLSTSRNTALTNTTLPTIEMPTPVGPPADISRLESSASNHRTPGRRSVKPPEDLSHVPRIRSQAPSPPPVQSFTARYPSEIATQQSTDSDSEPLSHKVARRCTGSPDAKAEPKDSHAEEQRLNSKKHLAELKKLHPNPVLAQAKLEGRRLQQRDLRSNFETPIRKQRRMTDSGPHSIANASNTHELSANRENVAIETLWANITGSARPDRGPTHHMQPSDLDTPIGDELDPEDGIYNSADIIHLNAQLPRKRQPKLRKSEIDAALALRADLPLDYLRAAHIAARVAPTGFNPDSNERISELTVILRAAHAELTELRRNKPADELVRAANRLVGTASSPESPITARQQQLQNLRSSNFRAMSPERTELTRIAKEREDEINGLNEANEGLRVDVGRLDARNHRLKRQKDELKSENERLEKKISWMESEWHAERSGNRDLSDPEGTSEPPNYTDEEEEWE